MMTQTGVGTIFGSWVIGLGEKSLFLALIMTMLLSILLLHLHLVLRLLGLLRERFGEAGALPLTRCMPCANGTTSLGGASPSCGACDDAAGPKLWGDGGEPQVGSG